MTRLGTVGLLVLVSAMAVQAAPPSDIPAVRRGVDYLKAHAAGQPPGESAIMGLAMIKAGVPATDPGLATCLSNVMAHFSGTSYTPLRSDGTDIYEMGCVAMMLANLDAKAYKDHLQDIASKLVAAQAGNGSWDYANRRGRGDTSISQYAVLGLWEACEQGGAKIHPSVWDRAARWYISVQYGGGSWNYHRDEANFPETISMTAAGIGCLIICQSQLADYRRTFEVISPLLTPIETDDSRVRYNPQTSVAEINRAVQKGLAWMGSNFLVDKGGPMTPMGSTGYYGLYGVERAGALAKQDRLGSHDWYAEGRRFMESTQDGDGHWEAMHGAVANTSWSVLFLVRAAAETIRKINIRRLGAGTLLGGRGLPKNLSDLTVASGRVVVRPLNGAVQDMLKVLEDPKAENADAAVAGLLAEYDKRGPRALLPAKDRFRKLLTDPDPGIRRVAAWALARTGELDVAPALIAALRDDPDPDHQVMLEARTGLQMLSRKVDGYGPSANATREQRIEAARKWREWYNASRPVDQAAEQDDDRGTPPAR